MWSTAILSDKDRLLAYLMRDEVYGAYAIGDLEPGMFELSTFAVAESDGAVQAMALHFRGLEVPALFLMGDADGVDAVLARELRPDRVYLTLREKHLSTARKHFSWDYAAPMWRMALRPGTFRDPGGGCVRLGPEHLDQLLTLYSFGGADAFAPSQVEHGVFFGCFNGHEIIAAAGTHLVSPTYRLAAVGNVFVHPEYRRQGLGSAATGAVVAEVIRGGAELVILNVSQDNDPAVSMYQKMGFECSCPFLECPVAVAAGAPIGSILK